MNKALASAIVIMFTLSAALGESDSPSRVNRKEEPVMKDTSSNVTGAALQDLRIDIVYDNYPFAEGLEPAWGFSCLVRGAEKAVLLDTGGDGAILLANMAKLGLDPKGIDLIVISHDHLDHTGGLRDLLKVCESPLLYLLEPFSPELKGDAKALGAKLVIHSEPGEICGNVFTTGEMGKQTPEQALILRTKAGLIVITGCAHPGVVEMTRQAKEMLKEDVLLVMGGFHLLRHSPEDIEGVISDLKELSVRNVAPSHCSGDTARELFKKAFGDNFIELGTGKVITLADLTKR